VSEARAPRGIHHLAIQVRDLAAVERFYSEALGLRVTRRWPWRDGRPGERAVWLALGELEEDGFLALEVVTEGPAAADDPSRATRPGLHLVALRIERAARSAWERRLATAGVLVEARSSFTLYVRDPEGNRVGLSHFPEEIDG
jgi:catechol 2,3-dioxygenase-like lactoylglutathione lyase family enzyme